MKNNILVGITAMNQGFHYSYFHDTGRNTFPHTANVLKHRTKCCWGKDEEVREFCASGLAGFFTELLKQR